MGSEMCIRDSFQVLLARYSGQEDILVGTPVANRQRMELEQLIGFFVNTLVMRGDLSGKPSFRELVRRGRQTALEAYQHQDLPFEALVKELNPVRDLSRHPLFQVMFAMQNAPEHPLALAGLETAPYELRGTTTHFDLELHVWERGGSWQGRIVYNTDLFDAETIERMAGHYLVLLENLLTDPDRPVLQALILTDAERHHILVEWNRTERDYPRDKCIHQLFEEQVERTPDAVAVVFEDQSLTYRQLDYRANQVAQRLHFMGVGPGLLAGIQIERSLEMVIGVLGILKAGGAYWALEDNWPQERLRLMLEEAHPRLLLTRQKTVHQLSLLTGQAGVNVPPVVAIEDMLAMSATQTMVRIPPPTAEQPAYVSYTSGSTGRPKGVVVPHRAVVRLVKNADYISLTGEDVLLQVSPLAFDASTLEIWGALLNGGRIVLLPSAPPALAEIGEAIRRQGVTTLWLTAGLFHLMVEEHLDDLKPLRQLLAGGDVLMPEKVCKARRALSGCRIINGYGPTENTTFTCCYEVRDEQSLACGVPIGRPIANTRVYVLDSCLQPVPVGVAGELYAGGDGVACGYLNQPELTAERFIPDPFSGKPGARLYRTGDRVRWRADGNLEFLGRWDTQVKIRGFRVELGEIEAVLGGQPGISEAVATVREDVPGDKRLVAYLVVKSGHKLEVANLRQGLAAGLPDYMIPAQFVVLPALPLTPNGKVNRQALPAPETGGGDPSSGDGLPRNLVELELVQVWQELFQRRDIRRQDNFFELGGHSLLAARLATEIGRKFRHQIPIAALFQSPTIELLARRLMDEHWAPPWGSLVPLQTQGSKPPLFFVHGWGGNVFVFTELARMLAPDQPAYGLQAVGLDGRQPRHKSVEEMARHYADEVMSFQPQGPYFLCGYSLGGIIAYELGQQLRARGGDVAMVMMLDTNLVILPWPVILPLKGTWFLGRLGHHLKQFVLSGWGDRLRYLRGRRRAFQIIAARQLGEEPPREDPAQTKADEPDLKSEYYVRVSNVYRAKPCRFPLLLVMAASTDVRRLLWTWRYLARAGLSTEPFAAPHLEMLNSTNVGQLAAVLRKHLEKAQQGFPPQPEA